MVPNVHASKLPARKSRDIARDNMRVLVVNKHGRFGQLKNFRVPLLFSMKVLFIEEKIIKKIISQKQSEKRAQVSQSWPKRGKKRIFQERKRKGEVGSPASRKVRPLRSVGHYILLQNGQVETSEHLDLLSS